MDCELCKMPLVVVDLNDLNKPLRCSDSCPQNRQSLADRKINPQEETNETDDRELA